MTPSLLLPDPNEPRTPRTGTHAPVVEPSWLDRVTGALDVIPGWVWAVALTTLTVLTVVLLPWARAQAFKAGRRTAGHDKADAKGTALFIAAMLPAAFFWLAVLAGSFRGLAGFGKDTLGWTDGWQFLVPLTLDGVAISFAFLAFRAVRAERSPQRAIRIVMGAAAASALINYGHEVAHGGSRLGGAYLGLLSVLGMLIFHEFLDQFTEGAAYVQRVNPSFGMRWITWPSNTVCAWVAWRNYPPKPLPSDASDAQRMWWGSINHAVAHLASVRRAKRIARFTADVVDGRMPAPWWSALVPWARVRQLDAALAEQAAATTAREAEYAEIAERLDRVASEHAEVVRRAEALASERASATADHGSKIAALEAEVAAARREAEDLRRASDRASVEHAEAIARVRAEAAEAVATAKAEAATTRLDDYRSGGARKTSASRRRSTPEAAPKTSMSDEDAVQKCIDEHPEPNFTWNQAEIVKVTGCGWGRAPRLLSAVAEYHAGGRSEATTGGSTETASDDDKEGATGAFARAIAG